MEEDYTVCGRCGGRGKCLRSEENGWYYDEGLELKVYPEKGDPNDEFECPKCCGRGEVFMTPLEDVDGGFVHPRHREYWDTEEGRKHLKDQKKKMKKKQQQ